MIANENKAVFAKLINGSLVQVQLGEPKSLEIQGFFHYQRFYDITKALHHEYAKLKLSHATLTDDLKSMKQDLVQLDKIRLCVDDLMEQQGMEIPIPGMPKELEAKPEKEQQRHEERTENAMQIYIRHVREAREQQKKQWTEKKRTGDMER